MTRELASAAADVVDLLAATSDREPLASRTDALRERHASTQITLIPQRDELSGQCEYGALLRSNGETVFVAYRRPSESPFLLRQAHRWRDSDLVSVDGIVMSTAEAVAAIDEVLGRASVQRRLVDLCIFRRAVVDRRIHVSEQEVTAAMDELRLAQRLHSAEATREWLQQRGMSYERFEDMARFHAQIRALRRCVAEGRVDAHFHEHRAEFECASLLRAWFANRELALRSVPREIRTTEDFLRWAAERMSEAAPDPRLDMVVMTRGEMSPETASSAFDTANPRVLGPLDGANGAFLGWVTATTPALALDDRIRSLVERRLFEEWMSEQRTRAVVEWNWGRAAWGA